ncbi:MAG TPA: hypothetical protein DD979_11325 [Gammaproteobacteria bacterium]|jgi:hypothetical protein|nr:hypothetical protein [Gammaproteobacteria bacterium]
MSIQSHTHWRQALVVATLAIFLSACSSDDDDSPDTDPTDEGQSQNGETPEPTAEGRFADPVDSPVLDFSESRVYWDMETNSIVSASDDWELSVRVDGQDYPIQVNGGASGEGNAGIGILLLDSAQDVTDPSDKTQVYQFFGDIATGVLSTPGDYGAFEYSVEGQHQMWPTFATYLLKDATGNLFKMQVISNYGEDGQQRSGNLVVRYASAAVDTTVAAMDATDASVAAKFDMIRSQTVADNAWQFAYQRYLGFTTNGGTSGDGGVSGCVVASYPALYDDQGQPVAEAFKTLTGESTLADFESVAMVEADCLGEGMVADNIDTLVETEHWLDADYSSGAPQFAAKEDVTNAWIVRGAADDSDGNRAYARVRVKEVNVDLAGAQPSRQLVLSTEMWVSGQ